MTAVAFTEFYHYCGQGQLCFCRGFYAVDYHIHTYRVGTDNVSNSRVVKSPARELRCPVSKVCNLSEPQLPYP